MIQDLPSVFQELASLGCLSQKEVHTTADGFSMAAISIADMLIAKDITTFPNSQGQLRDCDKFFDDWYLYAVPGEDGHVYSLCKMREQEHDAENGAPADGDTPGVTVSFIAFHTDALLTCINAPTQFNRLTLSEEINRVVAARGQSHHFALKEYFKNPRSQGSYLIARLYVQHIAGFALNGRLRVPDQYAAVYRQTKDVEKPGKKARLPHFIADNNRSAGYTICDHEVIFLRDPGCLSVHEMRAILATHTANVNAHSFAAEVRYHACFLVWLAKIPIPFLGRSIYDSAIRADMTISETELEGPAPFHNLNSKWVRIQETLHREW